LRGEVKINPTAEGDRGVVPKRPSSGTAHPEAQSFPISPNAPYVHPYYWTPFFLMGNWL
jgi:CHAT domain-containing protein